MQWWHWPGWPTAEEWQAWWSFVTVLVAAAAAWFAVRQYRISVRSHLEQARPYVTVDFEFVHGGVVLEVKNTGITAAEQLHFTWSERPKADHPKNQAAIDRALVDNGIPFLAPGRSIRFWLGEFDDYMKPRQFRVSMTYVGSGDGETWASKSILDLDQWAESLADRDPYESIAGPLNELAMHARIAHVGRPAPTIEEKAAESLHAYLEAQPEVKRYRRRRAREIAERNRHVMQKLRPGGPSGQTSKSDEGDMSGV